MSINDKKRKAVLIVVDSCGVGALPDAKDFGDEGVNTISHLAKAAGGVKRGKPQYGAHYGDGAGGERRTDSGHQYGNERN